MAATLSQPQRVKQINGPTHMVGGGHHLRNKSPSHLLKKWEKMQIYAYVS